MYSKVDDEEQYQGGISPMHCVANVPGADDQIVETGGKPVHRALNQDKHQANQEVGQRTHEAIYPALRKDSP